MNDEEKLQRLYQLLSEYKSAYESNRLHHYQPYSFQQAFHNAVDEEGSLARQRALIAANQVGKTLCAGFEAAMHLTGIYPDWWEGHRFTKPISLLAAGNTNDRTRDIVQSELFGDPQNPSSLGTGAIPKHLIGTTTRKPGVPNALSSAMVKHASGGWSKVMLMSYEQGKDAFMGGRLDAAWCDEEPPEEVWSQIQRAVFAKKYATLFLTFTPENGMTSVVDQFLNDAKPGQAVVRAGWDDAPHMTPEEQEKHLATLPPHERDMRSKGIPMLGSGLVFPVAEEDIVVEPFDIPLYWPRGCGIDFGYDHPFAAAWLAWDREADCLYLYDCFKQRKTTPPIHASAIKRRGEWIPVFWPHDGHQSDKGSGKSLAGQYRDEGVNMFGTHFTNPPGPGQDEGQGGASIEAGISEMLTRMETSRFKVFSHCQEWLEERRMYHRKDGRLVPLKDDCISASRYATQMRRYFHTRPVPRRQEAAVAAMTNW